MTDPDVLIIDHFQESGAFVWPSFDQCSKSRAKQESSHRDIENNPSCAATKHTLHDPASFLPTLVNAGRAIASGVGIPEPDDTTGNSCAHDHMFST